MANPDTGMPLGSALPALAGAVYLRLRAKA